MVNRCMVNWLVMTMTMAVAVVYRLVMHSSMLDHNITMVPTVIGVDMRSSMVLGRHMMSGIAARSHLFLINIFTLIN